MTIPAKIQIRFAGEDDWGRAVFKGDNGRFYKTTRLNPDGGFNCLCPEAQRDFVQDLHTCDGEFHGEPCSPCNMDRFEMVGGVPHNGADTA